MWEKASNQYVGKGSQSASKYNPATPNQYHLCHSVRERGGEIFSLLPSAEEASLFSQAHPGEQTLDSCQHRCRAVKV